MLYNQSTGKPDVLSSQSLIAWLEQQPADKSYVWHDMDNCGAAQYLRANGEPLYKMNRIPYWAEIFGNPESWTFGAAAKRARSLQP